MAFLQFVHLLMVRPQQFIRGPKFQAILKQAEDTIQEDEKTGGDVSTKQPLSMQALAEQ